MSAAFWLASALFLHGALTLLAGGPRLPAQVPAEPRGPELRLVPVSLESAKPAPGPVPGGGAPAPAAIVQKPAAPRRVDRPAPARVTLPAPPNEPEPPAESPEVIAAPPEPEAAPDLVSRASNHVGAAQAAPRGVPPVVRVAPERAALGPYFGAGPGSRSGPGGPGAGFGAGGGRLVTPFVFGGPKGAFRAEVCFIPPTTQTLRQIRGCKTEVTFFTDHLDIPPRSFTDGFPGITARAEWFAIYYHGRFRVQSSDYFTFHLISDDGSLLYVDGHLIIDNDRQHPPASKRATIPLAAGEHVLNVEYYQGPRDRIALQLFVAGSDGREKLFGPVI